MDGNLCTAWVAPGAGAAISTLLNAMAFIERGSPEAQRLRELAQAHLRDLREEHGGILYRTNLFLTVDLLGTGGRLKLYDLERIANCK